MPIKPPSTPPKRELSDQEIRAFSMLATWEELVDDHRIYGTLEMSTGALETIKHYEIAEPLKVLPSTNKDINRRAVRFDLIQLAKYLKYVCQCVGFQVDIHGEVTTKDGIKMTIPCNPKPTRKK